MTMQLTQTSEHFLINIGATTTAARTLAELVAKANTPNSTQAHGPAGFVQIDLTDPNNTIVLAIADDHHSWNLRADTTNYRITAYVEHDTLAASWAAATSLLTALTTIPAFDPFTITAAAVNEAIAESQF